MNSKYLETRRKIAPLLIGIVWFAACTDQPAVPSQTSPGTASRTAETTTTTSEDEETSPDDPLREIPAFVDNANCTEIPSAPAFCDWANAVDDIVFGQVVSASVVESNAVTYDGVPSRDCAWIEPALELEFRVDWSLHSTAVGTITVTFGELQMENWTTNIYLDANGDPSWTDPVAALTAGTKVGLALYREPNGSRWSPVGELFFTTSTADTSGSMIYAPSPGDCVEPPPSSVSGEALPALKTTYAQCGAVSATAAARSASRKGAWTTSPRVTHLATCHQDRPLAVDCSTDSACLPDEQCVQGSCEPL